MTTPAGLAIPLRIDPATGGFARASGDDKLKQNLMHLLLTDIGERLMRRDYGGGLRQLLYDPNDDALRLLAERQVAQAIMRHEPRLAVQSVRARVDGATLWIDLEYSIVRTRQAQRMSVPLDLAVTR